MDPVVVTVVVVVVVVLLVVGLLALLRRRKQGAARTEHLQERFGPEYDRTVADSEDARQAEARLARAEKRRAELDVRPLTAASRDRRMQQWASVQTMFVDAPVEAVDGADRLVADVMAERGYPTGEVEDKLTLLAADHAETVEHYRRAEGHRERFRTGEGSTEDLRRAFVEYRSLFDVLVDDGVVGTGGDADPAVGRGEHVATTTSDGPDDGARHERTDEQDSSGREDARHASTVTRPDEVDLRDPAAQRDDETRRS